MKVTFSGKIQAEEVSVSELVAEAIDEQVPTDLVGSTCEIVVTITPEMAKPPKPTKTTTKKPKPTKKTPPAPRKK
jgi:hypothetical protein